MFVDEIELTLKGGKGGDGRVSFFPGKKSGPDGGNGGAGGNVFIKASKDISNLNQFVGKKIISGEDGQETIEEIELTLDGLEVLVSKGGQGGKGNSEFKSSRNTTPTTAEKGSLGQSRHFKIVLKMIADFGLIGLPNAGKSSLLNELTNANVRVADYSFTTLQPNLGVINGKVIADIPGLVEGASKGRGLGINFLKHIEKVKLLLLCISCESENIQGDYKIIMKELAEFNPTLSKKRQIVLLTKSDLLDKKALDKKIKQIKKIHKEIYSISILDLESLNKLKKVLNYFSSLK